MAQTVAQRIEKDIVDSGWKVGSVLGSEPELIERYGVSRAVFREAVRLVEHQQIAAMRRGPSGGLVVTEPDPGVVRDAARVYLRRVDVTRQELFEARAALELAGIMAATERLTEEGIARLNAAIASEDELLASGINLGYARRLHTLIAELADNPAISLFIEVLAQLDEELVQSRYGSDAESLPRTAQNAQHSHAAHRAIVEAIISGDVSLAQHRMRRHLRGISQLIDQDQTHG